MSKRQKLFAFDLLRHQTVSAIEDEFAEIDDWALGDSEIERLFHAALHAVTKHGRFEYERVHEPYDEHHLAFALENPTRFYTQLVLQRQVQIDRFRVDFLIRAYTMGTVAKLTDTGVEKVNSQPHWRKLVVECDGHQFHERTKEQAASDRSRDRALMGFGYDVFRFTGSELWRDPWGCAEQVVEWAVRGY